MSTWQTPGRGVLVHSIPPVIFVWVNWTTRKASPARQPLYPMHIYGRLKLCTLAERSEWFSKMTTIATYDIDSQLAEELPAGVCFDLDAAEKYMAENEGKNALPHNLRPSDPATIVESLNEIDRIIGDAASDPFEM